MSDELQKRQDEDAAQVDSVEQVRYIHVGYTLWMSMAKRPGWIQCIAGQIHRIKTTYWVDWIALTGRYRRGS
jgi:hypothetical protein